MAYQPAGNLTSSTGYSHIHQVLYSKRALDRLQKIFVFRDACMQESLPLHSGRTIQFYRYINFAANTTESTEGTVGTSLAVNSRVVGASVSQYDAFITLSDFLVDIAPDPAVQNAAELLGYQAALSVDTITRNVIDSESAGANLAPLATFMRNADLRNATTQLQAIDVQPFDDGWFFAVMHPFNAFDLLNDPAVTGLADTFKYTAPRDTPLLKASDRGNFIKLSSCNVVISTNVKTLAGPTRYRTYVFGRQGVACIDLEGRGPSNVHDPRKQRFTINTIPGAPSIADPSGVIGGAVSYNFKFTAVVLDGPTGIGGVYRYRTIDAESTVG